MNATMETLISRQRERMRELREDAQDMAKTVADEVWDKFEVEVEKITENGYAFDVASMTKAALTAGLVSRYDEAFERRVLAFFERQQKELQTAFDAAEPDGFDSNQLWLSGMRKSIKLRKQAESMIGEAIERAKPGLFEILLAPSIESDDWDRDLMENASRLRSKLFDMRGKMCELIADETGNVIQMGRRSYIEMLDTLLAEIDKPLAVHG